MLKRLLFLILISFACFETQAYAIIKREIGGCGCGAGGGGGGALPLPKPGYAEEEPYRNADMGPLGVVLSNGEFQITVTDLEIPGRGIPFRLTRTYRSKKDIEGSFLGWNWHLEYDEYLHIGSYLDPAGYSHSAIQWTQGNGWRNIWVDWSGNGQYDAFGGFFGKIRNLGAGSGYQIRYPNGTVKTFGVYMLHPNGSPVWVLTRIEDRNANAITIQYKDGAAGSKVIDTITDTLGRRILFGYDADNRLTSVTDFTQPTARRVDYQYDTATGNLQSVKAPEVRTSLNNTNNFCEPAGTATCPQGRKTTIYTYASGCTESALTHNLKSITDAKGQVFLTNSYYSDNGTPACGLIGAFSDYMESQVYGGVTLTYRYASVPAPGSPPADCPVTTPPKPCQTVFRTTVTDRNGNVQVHDFNNQGNPLRVEHQTNSPHRSFNGHAEPSYIETYKYVDNGTSESPMLVSTQTQANGWNVIGDGNLSEYSEGMTIQNNYDQSNPDIFQRGNLLSVQQTPGPRGADQATLTTSYLYEPLFNQPLNIVDPRGHTTSFTYDYMEGTYDTAGSLGGLVLNSPRPSVDPVWWIHTPEHEEIKNFLAIWGNRLDLNGDSYHRGGNPVLISDGTATRTDGTVGEEIATYIAYNGFGLPTISRDAEFNETQFRYYSEDDPDGDGTHNPSPVPTDNRTLSGVSGANGGGHLYQKILDAPQLMPIPSPAPTGRESGQDPTEANVTLTFTYDQVGNIKTSTDGRGIRTDYTVNELNQVIEITHAANDSNAPVALRLSYKERFQYDANNNVIQHRKEQRDDPAQAIPIEANLRWVTTDFEYDILDRKKRETISTNDTVPLNGHDAVSLSTRYFYDNNGNLTKTIFPLGNQILRFYDERDLPYREVVLKDLPVDELSMIYNPAEDSVTEYDYDGSGNVIRVTDPEGHSARTGYDGYGRKVAAFDPAYQKSFFKYDDAGHLIEQIAYGKLGEQTPTPPSPPVSSYPEISHQHYYYDELGRLHRTDSRFFKYVGATLETKTLVPITTDQTAGLTTTPDGEPLPANDGYVTSHVTYDRLGRVVKSVDDKGHATETRYDGLGRTIKSLMNVASPFVLDGGDPLLNRNAIEYTYDPNGNVVSILETEYGADRSGGSVHLLDRQQYLSTFQYDTMNRQVQATLVGRVGSPSGPLNYTSNVYYDSRGNKIRVKDPAGGFTKAFFDGLNRKARTETGFVWSGPPPANDGTIPASMPSTSNPDRKITTTYAYDGNSRLSSITDDNNRVTSFIYDNLNRQTRINYADGKSRYVTYNRDSLATALTHSNNVNYALTTTTQYDWLHRPIQKNVNYVSAPQFTGTTKQSFEYDGLGRITRAYDEVDPNNRSEVLLDYNSMGKVLSDTQNWWDNSTGPTLSGSKAVASDYDGVGFRTSVIYPNDRTVTYTPDELNRISSITDDYTSETKYDYMGPSRVLNRIYHDGTKLTMLSGPADNVGEGYDDARRLVTFANKPNAGGAPIARFAYGYDPAGNRTSERRLDEPSGVDKWKGEEFKYDAVYRLINRTEGDIDLAGHATAPIATQDFTLDGLGNWKTHMKGAIAYNQTMNSVNQYTVFNGPEGQKTLQYDFAGNLINEIASESNQQYVYDFLNRLVTCVDYASNVTVYRYDALGRRISKNAQGFLLTRYVYDGNRLIQERDGANALVVSYVYGLGSDEVLTRRRLYGGSWSNLFYHTNALGSVVAVTDDSGVVKERYKYDAYGQVTFMSPLFAPRVISDAAVQNNVLFTGRYYDTETKLYYYRARTYHPYLGRFLQRDPLGEAASLNLYNYVFNNPANATDPTGMLSVSGPLVGVVVRGEGFGGGPSLQQRMQYRAGSYVHHGSAQYGNFDDEQADNDYIAAVDRENMEWEAHEARGKAYEAKQKVKQDAAKLRADSGSNKPFTLTLDLTRVAGSWEDQADGQANAAIQGMWKVAQDVYDDFDITIQDQDGNTDAKDINVQILGTGPSDGKASFNFMREQGLEPNTLNTISVLFSSEMASMGKCSGGVPGCTSSSSHMTIIPEFSALGKRDQFGGQGGLGTLAHEIGHNFGLPSYPGRATSPYTNLLMFEVGRWRSGTNRIPIADQFYLRFGSLPTIVNVFP